METADREKRQTLRMIYKYRNDHELSALIEVMEQHIPEAENEFRAEKTFLNFITQYKAHNTWHNEDPETTRVNIEEFEKRIKDALFVLKTWGISYTVNQYSHTMFERDGRRGVNHYTRVLFTVAKDQKAAVMDLIQQARLYACHKDADGWMEKMETSDFAKVLAHKIFEAHTADTDIRSLEKEDNQIRFRTDLNETVILSAAGKETDIHHVYNDYGYKDLVTQEQKYGLEGAVLINLIKELTDHGVPYVTVTRDKDCLIRLYFEPEKEQETAETEETPG